MRSPSSALVAPLAVSLVLPALAGCMPSLQQHARFKEAPVTPKVVSGHVGDVVAFDVRPPVLAGSEWTLSCHGYARFAGRATDAYYDWNPSDGPIRMEAVVSAFDPVKSYELNRAQNWLSYYLRDVTEEEGFGRPLPLLRLPYRELGPVTVSSTFANDPKRPVLSSERRGNRTYVTYAVRLETGAPSLPQARAVLLETDGRKVLYAEVYTDFGEVSNERLAYDVVFSYPSSITGPIETVVVGWIGHGTYTAPFTVDRYTVPAG